MLIIVNTGGSLGHQGVHRARMKRRDETRSPFVQSSVFISLQTSVIVIGGHMWKNSGLLNEVYHLCIN